MANELTFTTSNSSYYKYYPHNTGTVDTFRWDSNSDFISYNHPTITITEWIKPEKEEKVMRIYEIILVDKVNCEIVENYRAVGKSPQEAMLDLNLNDETKSRLKKDEYELIFNEKGSFTPVKKEKE